MSNIMAAIGIEQLKKMNTFADFRKKIAIMYDKLLSLNPNIVFLNRDYKSVVPHIYVIRISNLLDRDGLKDAMEKKGIEIGVHYKPNHKLTFFKTKKKINLPVTDKLYEEIISLPIHPNISNIDIKYVVKTLTELIPKFLK